MHELVAEAKRLGRALAQDMTLAPAGEEVPLRIHSTEFEGEALAFSPAFLRFIGPICSCGRAAKCDPACHYERDHILSHLPTCEPACYPDTRFHASRHRNSPTRMKRALRQVRKLNPKAYDFLYLIVVLHYSFEAAMAKINDDHARRGQPELTPAQFGVLWVSGAGMLTSAF